MSASVKKAVRERDGYRCVRCGISDRRYRRVAGRGLEVHRKAPGTPYTVEGSETLCGACHAKEPKSPHGTAQYSCLRVPRAQLREALGLSPGDRLPTADTLLKLLRAVPRDACRAILAEPRPLRECQPRRKVLGVRLSRDLYRALRRLANEQGCSLHAVSLQLLEEGLRLYGRWPPPDGPS